MPITDPNEMETVDSHPEPEEVDILWMNDREVHVLLPDGEEAVWPIGSLVEELRGIQRLQLRVVDGDLEFIPVTAEVVPA